MPLPGAAAILLALLLCALLGLVNALGLTVIGIPSFIMTLAMMQIAAGISALLVRGQIAYKVPGLITTLGSGSIGGIPWIVIVAAIMLLGGHLVLTYTRFGRYVYMVGGNREAAEYSGLNVKLILGAVMVISAVCSGIGGMLGVAHFGSAQQNEFDTYLLDSIAAVVVGGTSLFGGRGGIGNTIVGLFVLGVLNNGLDHVNIDSFLKILIRGADPAGGADHQRLCAAACERKRRTRSGLKTKSAKTTPCTVQIIGEFGAEQFELPPQRGLTRRAKQEHDVIMAVCVDRLRTAPQPPSSRAQRSNPDCRRGKILDCFAALAMTR